MLLSLTRSVIFFAVCLYEAGSTLVASCSCTHGPRFSLLIRFLVSIKFEHLPYFNFYQHGSIDRCIIIIPTVIALWRYNDSQCSLHITYVSQTRPIYSIIVWTRPFGWQQLVLSKKKLQSSKGVFHGNHGNPPGSATEYSVPVIDACLGHV